MQTTPDAAMACPRPDGRVPSRLWGSRSESQRIESRILQLVRKELADRVPMYADLVRHLLSDAAPKETIFFQQLGQLNLDLHYSLPPVPIWISPAPSASPFGTVHVRHANHRH
jgi:hypothetical protein